MTGAPTIRSLRRHAARGLDVFSSRPVLVAALVYALLAALFVSPALAPGKVFSNSDLNWFLPPFDSSRPAKLVRPANFELGDIPSVLQPFLRYGKARLPDIPLWNPHIMAGRPFLADAQSAIFSPFSLPAYILPFFSSLALIAALKLFVAAFGTFLLARSLGMRFGGALLAGCVYAFNLWFVAWLAFPHASVWALIPWLLLATDAVVKRPDGLSFAGLAAVAALLLVCGHPESSFHGCVAAVAFFALRALRAGARARSAAVFAGAMVCGAGLAAVALVPFGELLLHSADIHQRAGVGSSEPALGRDNAIGLFLPDYWGRPTHVSLRVYFTARALYAGVLPLMLAAVALVLRPTVERIAIAVFGFCALAVVLGVPPIFQVVTALPGFSIGHNGRLVILYMLCVALLAGWGLDELTGERRSSRRRWVAIAVATTIMLVPIVFAVVGHRTSLSVAGDALKVALETAEPPAALYPTAGPVIRGATLILWTAFASVGLALIAVSLRRRVRVGALVAIAVLVVAADLFRAGMGINPAIDRDVATQPATGSIRYLQAHRATRFVSTGGGLPNILSMTYGTYDAAGYDLPVERRYDHLWHTRISPEFPSEPNLKVPKVTRSRLRTLSLLGVTNVLVPIGDPPLGVPGLRLAYSGTDARVYANSGALPRAFVAGSQHIVGDGESALRLTTSRGFDARSAVVVERRVRGLPVAPRSPAGGGSARIVTYHPERVTIRARSRGPGMLVLTDSDFPGWKATVDGKDAPVERVDFVLRGVLLPAGTHDVEFRYQPVSWTIGRVVSAIALLAIIAAAVLGRRRRRLLPRDP